ncbi:MAG TPA: hypothetical protein ENH50_03280 [Nitrospirae bacterium]|nr:hypothetical protein BMS3Abin08_01079 [bacterium BMS3Abin08]HDY70671.1 hypothetical protein [Nitrospirota bacterium]
MKRKNIVAACFLIAAMSGLLTISYADQRNVKNSTGIPTKTLEGGAPINTKVEPMQMIPRPGNLQVKPSLPAQLKRYRDIFGENNEDIGHAFQLPDLNHTYTAACSHREDVDWYKFTVPSSGLGSWVQITVRSIKPATHRWLLNLTGPDQGGWEYTPTDGLTSGSFWVALKAGLTAYIKIKSQWGQWGSQPDEACVLDYDLTLQSGVILDVQASVDDYSHASIVLRPNQPTTAYMAEVGDTNGNAVGYLDWFKFDFQSCVNYCVDISRAGIIQMQQNDSGGCGEGGAIQHFCYDEGGCRGAKDGGTGYIGIEPVEPATENLSFAGRGEVPQRYKTPYTITLMQSGIAANSEGCSP